MRYKFFPAILILFISLATFSQGKKFTYYFDDQLNSIEKSKSVFTGTGIIENNLVTLQIVYNQTKQPLIIAHYIDSSLTVSQGLFQSFFCKWYKRFRRELQ